VVEAAEVDSEFAELLPLFASEARERLDRLIALAPQIERDPQALVEIKRELHTVKGAARMMNIPAVAELAHAAEGLVKSPRSDVSELLLRAGDRLIAMVEQAAAGVLPAPDAALVALLAGPRFGDLPDEVAPRAAVAAVSGPIAGPSGPVAGPAAAGNLETPHAASGGPLPAAAPIEPLEVGPEASATSLPGPPEGRGDGEEGAGEETGGAAGERRRPPAGGSTASAEARRGREPTPTGTQADLRLDPVQVDGLAEGAGRLRLLALAGRPFVERLYELAELAEQGVREPTPVQVLALLASSLRRAAVELEGNQRRLGQVADGHFETVLGLQLQPLRPFLNALSRHARDLARGLGREVEVELEGEDTRLDRRIARELEGALLHLVRNAVDHGLESPGERRAAGKAPGGRLRLAARSDGARVRLEIADDGRGIEAREVVRRAVERRLVAAAEGAALTPPEALRLIFLPGFSTRDEVSEVSGRGVGLDAVWMAAVRVGGEVAVASSPGRGTTFTLTVPVARRGEQVLVLRIGRLRLALPRAAVTRVERLAPGSLVERGEVVLARTADERLVPSLLLARAFGEEPASELLLLEGTVNAQSFALLVDAVSGEQEVLVRPLGRVLAGSPMLEGLALLASGEPVGVLSPTALLRHGELPLPRLPPRAAPTARRLRLLLVDDSLVTREMERRLLVDAGFDVVAAADAVEALTHLGESAFDCVITDVEMPGMDGFELVRHLRGMPHLAGLPVVVVSTRDRPEDRLRGLEAGADAYLTKQGLDAGELVGVVRRLAG
jgi:two-component system chemotaxis sensor kinase CheA